MLVSCKGVSVRETESTVFWKTSFIHIANMKSNLSEGRQLYYNLQTDAGRVTATVTGSSSAGTSWQ